MRVLITGANGFVGGALLSRLQLDGRMKVRAATRRGMRIAADQVTVGRLTSTTDWTVALRNVNVVVHTAAHVHQMRPPSASALAEMRRVNIDATMNLARQAAGAGARRFVFVSSIKVLGDVTSPGRPFRASDAPAPTEPYAVSKLEAEVALKKLAGESDLEVVIVRPPLVYGPGVKANFQAMIRWVHRGVPLPLGAVHNKRSFVAVDNLVDLLTICTHHPRAANRTFLVSDGEDLSTSELLRRIGNALGTPARLFPVPVGMLRVAATLGGKGDYVKRLCGSLQVDIADTTRLLDWDPPSTADAGLAATVADYLAQVKR